MLDSFGERDQIPNQEPRPDISNGIFPESYKGEYAFHPKTWSGNEYYEKNIWIDLENEPSSIDKTSEHKVVTRNNINGLAKYYELAGEGGLRNFFRFYNAESNRLNNAINRERLATLQIDIAKLNFPDVVKENTDLTFNNGDDQIIGFKIQDYYYKLAQKNVREVEEWYDGGNSLRDEESTYNVYTVKRYHWQKEKLDARDTLDELSIPGVSSIKDVRVLKMEPNERQLELKGLLEESDIKWVKACAEFEKSGGKNTTHWYCDDFKKFLPPQIGNNYYVCEEIGKTIAEELRAYLKQNCSQDYLEKYGIKREGHYDYGAGDINIKVSFDNNAHPTYANIELKEVGKGGVCFRNIFELVSQRGVPNLSIDNITRINDGLELAKKVAQFCLEKFKSKEPKVETPKYDAVLYIQDHKGKTGFEPSFEDDRVVFYDVDTIKDFQTIKAGEKYAVLFIGEAKPMLDSRKTQKRDRRGQPMFRQKVKIVFKTGLQHN